MIYRLAKTNRRNLKRYVAFQIIEKIVVYNQGQIFDEYVRFYGSQLFVIYEDGNIRLTPEEDEASVFFDVGNQLTLTDNDPNFVFRKIIDKLKSGEIDGDGIVVIEYNELHMRSSEVLHYPNYCYPDLIQPIKIYKGKSKSYRDALERKCREEYFDAFEECRNYLISMFNLTADDWNYINTLTTYGLRHLLETNIGRRDFKRLPERLFRKFD